MYDMIEYRGIFSYAKGGKFFYCGLLDGRHHGYYHARPDKIIYLYPINDAQFVTHKLTPNKGRYFHNGHGRYIFGDENLDNGFVNIYGYYPNFLTSDGTVVFMCQNGDFSRRRQPPLKFSNMIDKDKPIYEHKCFQCGCEFVSFRKRHFLCSNKCANQKSRNDRAHKAHYDACGFDAEPYVNLKSNSDVGLPVPRARLKPWGPGNRHYQQHINAREVRCNNEFVGYMTRPTARRLRIFFYELARNSEFNIDPRAVIVGGKGLTVKGSDGSILQCTATTALDYRNYGCYPLDTSRNIA